MTMRFAAALAVGLAAAMVPAALAQSWPTHAVRMIMPDGYTLLMATGSAHSVAPYVSKVPYDPRKEFTPIVYAGYATSWSSA